VKVLEGAKIVTTVDGKSYSVEASIPLKDLGLAAAPTAGTVMKMDWGVLTTDDGFVTRSRRYWANPIASGVADEPTEARLEPAMWGYARFAAPASKASMTDPLQPKTSDDSLDDLLEELE
jgi:hypothetical protein